jgi:hypothetical protein
MKFFAEELARLGVVNVQIQLDTPSSDSTVLHTQSGSFRAVLRHEETEHTLLLPSPSTRTDAIPFPADKSIIQYRVPIAPSTTVSEPTPLISADTIQAICSQGGKLSCSACHCPLLRDGQFRWKDLPSDSWQEYSGSWLCHRGSSHTHSHTHTSNNHSHTRTPIPTLTATQTTALVGLTFLLVSPSSLQHISIQVPFPVPLSHRT